MRDPLLPHIPRKNSAMRYQGVFVILHASLPFLKWQSQLQKPGIPNSPYDGSAVLVDAAVVRSRPVNVTCAAFERNQSQHHSGAAAAAAGRLDGCGR